jgi:hypothetical protein
MVSRNLESLPEDIFRLIQERQLELEKKDIHKSLEDIYRTLMSERLKALRGNVKKEYPKLE